MATGHSCFFYGTLMSSQVLSRVIYGTTTPEKWQSASLRIRPALLEGHCRHKVRFVDYPGIIPEEGKTVKGTYVEGLTDGDMWRLDKFEGDEYARKKVRVKLLDANNTALEEKETQTYIWADRKDLLELEEWDFTHFAQEKLPRWISDSREYVDSDQALPDPLGGRWWGDGFANDGGTVNNAELKSAV